MVDVGSCENTLYSNRVTYLIKLIQGFFKIISQSFWEKLMGFLLPLLAQWCHHASKNCIFHKTTVSLSLCFRWWYSTGESKGRSGRWRETYIQNREGFFIILSEWWHGWNVLWRVWLGITLSKFMDVGVRMTIWNQFWINTGVFLSRLLLWFVLISWVPSNFCLFWGWRIW